MVKKALLALLAATLLLPAASAQGITLRMTDEAVMVPASGSTTLDFWIDVDCELFLTQQATSLAFTVTNDLDDWFGAADGQASASGMDCLTGLPGTTTTATGTVTITPTAAALGYMARNPTFTASGAGTSDTFSFEQPIQVDYVEGHTIVPSIQFPYNATAEEVAAGAVSFDLDVAVQANSRTMVMFMEIATDKGAVSGLKHIIFEVEEGHVQETLTVTATLPSGSWQNMTISFRNFSHCLKGAECPEMLESHHDWTIINPGGAPASSGGNKESPSLGFMALLGLVGVAFLARRRSA